MRKIPSTDPPTSSVPAKAIVHQNHHNPISLFCLVSVIHYASSSACPMLHYCDIVIQIPTPNHLGSMEDPATLQDSRHMRPNVTTYSGNVDEFQSDQALTGRCLCGGSGQNPGWLQQTQSRLRRFSQTQVHPFNPLSKLLNQLLFGDGLVGLSSEKWTLNRRITSRAFSMERVKVIYVLFSYKYHLFYAFGFLSIHMQQVSCTLILFYIKTINVLYLTKIQSVKLSDIVGPVQQSSH